MTLQQRQAQILQLRGINLSDDYQDGSLADSSRISSKRYPYFATRNKREMVGDWEGVTAMTSWNKLVVVKGTKLYYDGNEVGTVLEGEKQFAVVNTKLVIMPDKKYLDMQTLQLVDMAVSFSQSKSISTTAPDNDGKETLTMYSTTLPSDKWGLNLGDVIEIEFDSKTFSLQIKDIQQSGSNVVFTFAEMKKKDNFTNVSQHTTTLKLSRKIPDFDYICEADNRIWGCVNSEQTIYASALGDPTNFFDYTGESTDSYAVAVGSEGNFTGCHRLGSSVLFFKSNLLHKVVGDYPANYAVYTYSIEGVKEGCFRSMQIINETLLYMGSSGVFSYGGGTTNFLSMPLGNKNYTDAVAGTDGEKYYLSCKNGTDKHLFIYDIKNNLWLRDGASEVTCFARSVDTMYMLIDGRIYIDGDSPLDTAWSMTFNPFYESATYRGRKSSAVFNKRSYSQLIMRVEAPVNTHAVVEVRIDGGRWQEIGTIVGNKEGVVTKVIPLNRCDKFELKLHGNGEFCLLNLSRIYTTGSERSE